MIIQPQSFLASLFHSAVWNTAAKGVSLFKHIVIAAAIGLSSQLDVFYMALAIFGLLIDVWGMTLTVLAVPYLVKLNDRKFATHATAIIGITFIASVMLAVVFFTFRAPISQLALGFDNSGKSVLAEAFIWLAPFIVLHVPASAIGAALRAKRLFSPVYQANALSAVVILVCIIAAPTNPKVLFWSLSLGTICTFLYSGLFFLAHFGGEPGSILRIDREVLKVFKGAPGLLVLHGTYTCFIILDRVFASFLPGVGGISALAYALTIAGILPTVLKIDGAFITVAAEKSSRAQRSETANDLFSFVILLSVGATAFFLVSCYDVVELLLERGAFSTADTESVTIALAAFAFMIAPIFLLPPLDQLFQIENRVGFMVRRTLLGITVGISLNYIAIFVLGWGIFGLALATTISYWFIVFAGIIGLFRMGYHVASKRHLMWVGWTSAFVCPAAILASHLPDLGSIMNIASSVILHGLFLSLGAALWRGREKMLLMAVIGRISEFGTRSK